MNSASLTTELINFLQQSPTPFHAVTNMAAMLSAAGFQRLDEAASWQLKADRGYFVERNDSSMVAFRTGSADMLQHGIRIAGTHTDSPCLKIKPEPVVTSQGYLQLGVEVYGGALLNPWFDRDLSLAGRIDFETDDQELRSVLLDLREPVAFIPSLAIHLDRGANDGHKLNPQTELSPLLLQLESEEDFDFDDYLLHAIQDRGAANAKRVLAHELLLYDTQAPSLVGLREQFIASARLDNLLSCFVACQALMDCAAHYASVLVCNDHEEVGSVSNSGAQGPFLRSVLDRALAAGSAPIDGFDRVMHKSTLLSIDNAHGVHPNYANKHDDKHRPLLNAGPVIKINANQRYASNSNCVAMFKALCDQLQIPHQSFVMRSDMACGSTIGPLTAAELGIQTVDVGVASFGMHSLRELAGANDVPLLYQAVNKYFSR